MAAGDQVAVPVKHRVRPHRQPQPARHISRQPVQQRGEERPVGRREPRPFPSQLALQYGDLVAQRQDLDALVPALLDSKRGIANSFVTPR
ncbi:hypothetical protein [Streptomyces hirsutus]|uniref:hypothetical protein n=1 Tax=Streptomyces hirsutus TaxID=35620 RepID=UPI0006E20DCD|nr:hypothetical protein [Streptomyces hirsutus]